MKSLLSKAIDNPDVTLATLGCVLAVPLTIYLHALIRSPVYTLVGVTVLLACLVYLLLRRRAIPSTPAQAEATPRVYLLLNISFFGLLTYSIAAFHLRPELYTRPLGYFIAIAAMAAVLAIEILFLPRRNSATYFALLKMVLIGLSLAWSQLLIYPSIVGVDPWWHQMFTLKILDAGHIPPGYPYSGLPVFHLLIGATSLVTGLDYKMATMFSVSLLQLICVVLFIFLLGKFIHSTRAGLLAALSLVVANYFIGFSYWTIPNTMGVVFIPIIIYLLFKFRAERPKVSIGLSALCMAVVLLTHTVASVMLAMLLFLIWLGFELYRWLRYPAAQRAKVFLVAPMLFTAAALGYWAVVSGHMRTLIAMARIGFGLEFFGIPPGEIAEYLDHIVPVSERLFNQLGFFLFLAFALIGTFAMLSRSLRNRYGFALLIAGMTILTVTFVGLVGQMDLLAGRWNYLLQVLLALPVGIGFLWLGSLPGRRFASSCVIGASVFVLSFLMVMSPQMNLDNLTFSPNTIVRYGFTESELEAANTAVNIYDGKIEGDQIYSHLRLLPELAGRIGSICDQLLSRDFTASQNSLVLIREEIVVNQFKVLRWHPFRLDYDPRQVLTEQGFSNVYNCGSVSGFIRSG